MKEPTKQDQDLLTIAYMYGVRDASKRIKELESDRRRLEWLVINNARVWLLDGWYDIHDNGGTCIVHMVDDWRDAIDKAMQECE